jgi:hypothetical protein
MDQDAGNAPHFHEFEHVMLALTLRVQHQSLSLILQPQLHVVTLVMNPPQPQGSNPRNGKNLKALKVLKSATQRGVIVLMH